MNKKELIKELEKLSYWEDDFVGKYDSEATWTLLKTLPPEKFRQVKKLLDEIISDTKRHRKMLKAAVEAQHG